MSNEDILENAVLLANNLIAEKDKEIANLQSKGRYFDELVDKKFAHKFQEYGKGASNSAESLHSVSARSKVDL